VSSSSSMISHQRCRIRKAESSSFLLRLSIFLVENFGLTGALRRSSDSVTALAATVHVKKEWDVRRLPGVRMPPSELQKLTYHETY
jgi:hypothetical protein